MDPTLAVLLLPLLCQGPTAPPAGPAPAQRSPLERIVVVGASVSEGFGLEREADGRMGLGRVLDGAVRVEHARVKNFSSQLLFVSPEAGGAQMLGKALAAEPTLVVGIDFLFWFAYGVITEEERFELFEIGLELLEDVPCPVLVGDLPDMSPAVRSPVPMITSGHVPSRDTLEKLNARLHEWAAESPDRVVVPLSRFVGRIHAAEEIELRGNAWKDYDRHRFLQPDLLHPTVEGTTALGMLVLDTLVESRETVPADAIRWSVRELVRELLPDDQEEEEEEEERSYGQTVMRIPFESATPDARLGSFMPAWL